MSCCIICALFDQRRFRSLSNPSQTMCYGHRQLDEEPKRLPTQRTATADSIRLLNLRLRLAATQARLARARAREAELSRRLKEMKRFVSVMDIVEGFLKRRYLEQHEDVMRLLSSIPERS